MMITMVIAIDDDRRWVDIIDFPAPALRDVWCTWLRKHGIDPNQVLVAPGRIVADDAAREVRYQAMHLGWSQAHNRKGCPDPERRSADVNEVCTEYIVVQLEGRPLPFPGGDK